MATNIGDVYRISAVFTIAGTVGDPTVVTFTYQKPDKTQTTLTYGVDGALAKDTTGNYHVDLVLDLAGTWYYRWTSTGTGQASEEGSFVVVQRSI